MRGNSAEDSDSRIAKALTKPMEDVVAKDEEKLRKVGDLIKKAEETNRATSLGGPADEPTQRISASAPIEQPMGGSERRKWFLMLATVLLVIGLAGGGFATILQIGSVLIFGPMFLAASMVQLFLGIFTKGMERLLHVASAGLELALGFAFMAQLPTAPAGGVFVVLCAVLDLVSHGTLWTLIRVAKGKSPVDE